MTRDELYEEVWRQPMVLLAKQCGVSDVAIAKVCRKLGIPVPPRGHWAKLKFGKASPKPSLPLATPNSQSMIEITPSPKVGQTQSDDPVVAATILAEEKPKNRVVVADRLSRPMRSCA